MLALDGLPTFDMLFREMTSGESTAANLETDPGAAFRAFYDGWVKLGGHNRGKPRRSVRQIKIWLGKNREVRSLETKLAGRTNLQRQDVRNLFSLFIENWHYDSLTGNEMPLLFKGNQEQLADALTSEILRTSTKQSAEILRLPLRGRSDSIQTSRNPNQTSPTSKALVNLKGRMQELFVESDALIMVVRQTNMVGSDLIASGEKFRDLIETMRSHDLKDDRYRSLIWILDLGHRKHGVGVPSHLHNVEFIAAQIRALLLSADGVEKQEILSWIMHRMVVLVSGLDYPIIDQIYEDAGITLGDPSLNRDWVSADRLLFEGLPAQWVASMAGVGADQLDQLSITISRSKANLSDQSSVSSGSDELRYLSHFDEKPVDDDVRSCCLDLPSLSDRWNDAFRLVHEIALFRLNREFVWSLPDSPNEALALLRTYSFAALNVLEFCELTNRMALSSLKYKTQKVDRL